MSNITNRSPWEVHLPAKKGAKKSAPQRFRLKSQALAFLTRNEVDVTNSSAHVLRQLQTAFEVQIKRKDSKGMEVKRQGTFDTLKQATDWAREQENELQAILQMQGGFTVAYETITVQEVLEALLEEHYKTKESYNEISYRIPRLAEWLGAKKRFRDLNRTDMTDLLTRLEAQEYSASSIRNYFTVLTTLYRFAKRRWHYPVENIAADMDLPKPANAIQRYWVGNEEERLMKAMALHSPWLIPIVELSLEMAFRRGELVQAPVRRTKVAGKDAANTAVPTLPSPANSGQPKKMSGGLKWEHLDWSTETLALPKEKNDHVKMPTEGKGRKVPITKKMREILQPLYDASPTKSGLVFQATINSVSKSFRLACEKADPPIENLTFHSLRKIATKNLSHRVTNPMDLGRLSGHKNIEVLNSRYYEATVEQLAALLRKSSGTIRDRGISALTTALGLPGAKQFILEIRALKDPEDVFNQGV